MQRYGKTAWPMPGREATSEFCAFAFWRDFMPFYVPRLGVRFHSIL